MSNPKEKAEDLVNQFRMVLMNEDTECGNEILCTSIAMKNAIICVKEIVEMQKNVSLNFDFNIKYWTEVIEEISKL
jgi:hypothetical protein